MYVTLGFGLSLLSSKLFFMCPILCFFSFPFLPSFSLIFFSFLKNYFIVVQLLITAVCIFSPPLPCTPAKPTSLPCFHPPPGFSPCVLYSSSWKPFSPLSPLAIVRLFLTSVSLVIFCLLFSFVDYVPVKRWDHMVFVPYCLACFS